MRKFIILLLICHMGFGQKTKRKLVFEENFSQNELNDSVWNFELGDGCPNLCGWGNNERQIYTTNNHTFKNGNLVITAQKKQSQYTSTKITTKGKKEFLYGRIEARAKLAVGKGIWPAFWMLGSNIDEVHWPKTGEIDIIEYVGKDPQTVYNTVHTQSSFGNTINTKKTPFPSIEEGFHVYAIDWSSEKIDFLVDEKIVYTYKPAVKNEDTWPFDKPFYILINLAVGGNFGGPEVDDTIFPQSFTIDYVRVYQ